MLFPVARKRNARYRGPAESRKVNDFYSEVAENLLTLREAFEVHEATLRNVRSHLDTSKPISGAQLSLSQSVMRMQDIVNSMKREGESL